MDAVAVGVARLAAGAAIAVLSAASGAQPAATEQRTAEHWRDCGSAVIVKCAPPAVTANDPPQRSLDHARGDLDARRRGEPQWLDEIVIEGRRVQQPTLREVLERDLPPPMSGPVRYETWHNTDGSACVRVLPYGYVECSKGGSARAAFPFSR